MIFIVPDLWATEDEIPHHVKVKLGMADVPFGPMPKKPIRGAVKCPSCGEVGGLNHYPDSCAVWCSRCGESNTYALLSAEETGSK